MLGRRFKISLSLKLTDGLRRRSSVIVVLDESHDIFFAFRAGRRGGHRHRDSGPMSSCESESRSIKAFGHCRALASSAGLPAGTPW